ncbi:MAG: peptide/nickel transport system ATP-binding protein [Acetobacteraceae bacterium]|nr:peptide/nickel transport system ATP-binding protein [Acetobacteraceae bacterium]
MLLDVTDLRKTFPAHTGLLGNVIDRVHAVDGVSFGIAQSRTLGLVGESGCGKSTVGRAILRLIEPSSGTVRFQGNDITSLSAKDLRALRRRMQIIFQDPYSSLNPRKRAGEIVAEPLMVHGIANAAERRDMVASLFAKVGLQSRQMSLYPHQFSGGQRQRISIARALSLGPSFIVADEPVSALDVSVQAQVINLLMDLQAQDGLSYLFISHNLAVVEHVSHDVAVMYLGRIVEHTDKATIFARPLHPYTRALMAAVPVPDPLLRRDKKHVMGDVPSPIHRPSGCHFHPRCPLAEMRCRTEDPELREVHPGHRVACHLV